MKQYVFKERGGILWGCLSLALFAAGTVYMYSAGIGAMLFVAVCGIFVTSVLVYTGVRTKTISETGICVKTILKTTEVPWPDVEKIGVAWLRLGPSAQWYLSVTYRAENRKNPGFLFPYTDALRDAVTECYGPLDFDESADPRGYSIVVDE